MESKVKVELSKETIHFMAISIFTEMSKNISKINNIENKNDTQLTEKRKENKSYENCRH